MTQKSAFRYFSFLVAGYSISSFGSYLNIVALNLFAYELTDSALQTGIFMALRLAASFLSGLVAGALVARYNRKLLMIVSDLAQAAALVLLVLGPTSARLGLLYGISIVFGCCGTLSLVALRSSIPEMVGQDQRVRANGMLVTGRSLATVLGFAAAGIIVAWAGYTTAFAIDALTFVISALILAWLPLSMRAAPTSDGADAPTPGFWQSQRAALALLKTAPVLVGMYLIRTADTFGSASHNVGMPVYATLASPQNPSAFMGRTWTAWALGSLLAYQVLNRVLKRDHSALGEHAFAIGTCLMSGAFILVFSGLPLPLMLLAAVVAGVADGFTEIAYTSRLQSVPDDQRSFVFGFSAMTESFGFGSGMILCAWLLETLPPISVVGLFHGIAIVLALVFLVFIISRSQHLKHTEHPG